MEFKITKSTVECYKIRPTKNSLAWADIVIDAKDNTGRISIASDYGSWQYYWNACGEPFKEFLCGIGMDYVAGKFKESSFFDADQTLAAIKEQINEYRDGSSIKQETAEKILTELEQLDGISHEHEFCRIFIDCDNTMKFYDGCPPLVRTISPSFKMFWKEIWPAFIKELKKELVTA